MQRVFITGASSGIGAGLARHYGVSGAKLGLLARRGELLESLKGELTTAGADVAVYVTDVCDTGAVNRAAAQFLDWAGGADLVIANAGVGLTGTPGADQAERVAHLMAINVIGVTNTVLAFVDAMRAQHSGVLVGMGSVAGHRALPGSAAYSASKAAVKTFMDGLRMDLAGSGVHAMTLCPGFIESPLTGKNKFKMPFLLDMDTAVGLMTRAIAARRDTYTFPWQMNAASFGLKRAPEAVVRRVARR